ncbi:DUF3817 domain-containing protein [Sciscionella marina]|uniref:DUF3817 domain-containing protein n=1 Tax=Sciscionella marina TaxID=508770 RepID=UPI00035EE3CB|nr:DUF3817 domain-containing protein [Sciscionella marina]
MSELASESQETNSPAAAKIPGALLRYRIIAYITGIGLLALCAAMVFKYGFDADAGVAIIGPLHGVFYMIYIVMAVDLALKARWSIKGTVWILLSGTIPFLSFVAERAVTRRVRAGRKL